jgi:hypothetical protein
MNSRGRAPYWVSCSALVLLAGARLEAQPPGEDVFFEAEAPPPAGGIAIQGDHIKVLSFEEGFETKQVKGAPYQAEAVTEIVQTLADGNRIVRKTSATVARDGEGRTRRETSLAAIGPLAPAEELPRTVFLSDPVAGARYVLEMEERVARRLPAAPTVHWEGKDGAPTDPTHAAAHRPVPHRKLFRKELPAGGPDRPMFVHRGPGADGTMVRKEIAGESEPLGTQVIEGVEAEGTRHKITIAAGEIGNERPIEIVSERWYSAELQAVVLSRRSDPRLGETTYRLVNINRAEPDHALFEVPADFTISDDKDGLVRKRLHILKQDRRPE